MSKYTTQLRWVVEQTLADMGLECKESNWKYAYPKLGLSDYEMWGNDDYPSAANRERLNNKIIRRYWFKEIGFETVAMFAWYMRSEMDLIMRYWNQMYASEIVALQIKPLSSYGETFDETRNRTWEEERSGSSESDSTSKDRNVYNDTPMGMLGNSGSPSIEGLDYATNVTYDDSESGTDTSSESAADGSEAVATHYEKDGFSTNQSAMLEAYRKTFLNIDEKIVEHLNVMFMGVF